MTSRVRPVRLYAELVVRLPPAPDGLPPCHRPQLAPLLGSPPASHQNDYRYVDQWPLIDVYQRCPTSDYSGLPPNPMPDFVPHNQTVIDIYPGERGSRPAGPASCTGARFRSLRSPAAERNLEDRTQKY